MRIGLFSDTFPPQINGVANSTYILYRELKKHGHEVYVITTATDRSNTGWNEDHTILRFSGIKLKFLYGYTMTGPFHIFAASEIRKLNLDIIHAQTEFGIGIFARIIAKELKIPLVSTYHTTYEDYTHYVNFLHSEKVENVSRKAVASLSRIYGDSSRKVISPSFKTKELLEKYGVETGITVIPTGLMLDSFSPDHLDPLKSEEIRKTYGIGSDEPLLIYVGRLAEEKSMDLVVRAFALIRKRTPQVKLLVVGGGPDLESLKKLAVKCGVDDRVFFAGPHPAEEIPDYYRAADAFISASLSETQGMTFIEAMASGLPLFARYDEVLQDLLIPGKTGWFFTDEEDLSKKVEEMTEMDAEKLKEFRENALRQVAPYSSEEFYRQVIQVYTRVTEGFHTEYTVVDLHVRDSAVQVYLKREDGKEEFRLSVSIENYYRYRLQREQVLTKQEVDTLKAAEEETNAYNRCVNRIASEDRTCKEIYDWLTRNTSCSIDTINGIVEKLEEKGYLNDERYCEEHVSALQASLHGRDYIIKALKKKGIPFETIEAALERSDSSEEESALAYAAKVMNKSKNDSVAKLKMKIRQKLIARGFGPDVTEDTLSRLDMTAAESREKDSLRECVLKAKHRYERKYDGYELRDRIYRACAAKGFAGEDITAALEEMNYDQED